MIADDSRKAAVRTAAMVQILLQKLQILIFSIQRLNVEFPAQRLPQEIIDRRVLILTIQPSLKNSFSTGSPCCG